MIRSRLYTGGGVNSGILYWSNQEVSTSQKHVTHDVVFALPVAGYSA
jgi:hypothetical protein